ncbi:M20 family metallo-hydrolase [Sinobaca sp. H24]|uniref:M20 family metallo-hydrolase n=1 Tax=Sinobaca sp. H24 TaxID=2923376 RepID=UPI002079993F|nr:M20 family metallo-hydrolase [Sinobaca sp. H24]
MTVNSSYHINNKRLTNRIHTLSRIGKIQETGVRRLAHSPEDVEGMELVKSWMEDAGLEARIDHFGNLIGRWEGTDPKAPVLLLGSHIDSQPYGGRFDGPIGVLGALESVQTLMEDGMTPSYPVEVIAFADEEGARFNKGLFGSRGILGEVTEEELERTDENGISRREALLRMNCDPSQFSSSVYPPGSIRAYLEMHIEQGPVLEEKNEPIGIVTGISGPLWLTATFTGFAGHAGSVPMHLRKDALLGASEAVTALHTIVSEHSPAPTVGTVGNMTIFPNSRNIIPETVSFTIDLRDIDLNRRNACEKKLMEELQAICRRRGLELDLQEDTRSDPRYCADWIMDYMKEEASDMGAASIPHLMSGPFHDALPLSQVCDYGMIFVRSENGISHNPAEFSTDEDIAAGTELYYRTLKRMLQT